MAKESIMDGMKFNLLNWFSFELNRLNLKMTMTHSKKSIQQSLVAWPYSKPLISDCQFPSPPLSWAPTMLFSPARSSPEAHSLTEEFNSASPFEKATFACSLDQCCSVASPIKRLPPQQESLALTSPTPVQICKFCDGESTLLPCSIATRMPTCLGSLSTRSPPASTSAPYPDTLPRAGSSGKAWSLSTHVSLREWNGQPQAAC